MGDNLKSNAPDGKSPAGQGLVITPPPVFVPTGAQDDPSYVNSSGQRVPQKTWQEKNRDNKPPHFDNPDKVSNGGPGKGPNRQGNGKQQGPPVNVTVSFPPPIAAPPIPPAAQNVHLEKGIDYTPPDNIHVNFQTSRLGPIIHQCVAIYGSLKAMHNYFQVCYGKLSFIDWFKGLFKGPLMNFIGMFASTTWKQTMMYFLKLLTNPFILLVLFRYLTRTLTLKTTLVKRVTLDNAVKRHNQNTVVQEVPTTFTTYDYDFSYVGTGSSLANYLPSSALSWVENITVYLDPITEVPLTEVVNDELLYCTMTPKNMSGHLSLTTSLQAIERTINNRQDTKTNVHDFHNHNTMRSTTTVAKYIAIDSNRRVSNLGFHNVSGTLNSNMVIGSLGCHLSGDRPSQDNLNGLSKALSQVQSVKESRGLVLYVELLAVMSMVLYYLSPILQTLWVHLPEKLNALRRRFRSIGAARLS